MGHFNSFCVSVELGAHPLHGFLQKPCLDSLQRLIECVSGKEDCLNIVSPSMYRVTPETSVRRRTRISRKHPSRDAISFSAKEHPPLCSPLWSATGFRRPKLPATPLAGGSATPPLLQGGPGRGATGPFYKRGFCSDTPATHSKLRKKGRQGCSYTLDVASAPLSPPHIPWL